MGTTERMAAAQAAGTAHTTENERMERLASLLSPDVVKAMRNRATCQQELHRSQQQDSKVNLLKKVAEEDRFWSPASTATTDSNNSSSRSSSSMGLSHSSGNHHAVVQRNLAGAEPRPREVLRASFQVSKALSSPEQNKQEHNNHHQKHQHHPDRDSSESPTTTTTTRAKASLPPSPPPLPSTSLVSPELLAQMQQRESWKKSQLSSTRTQNVIGQRAASSKDLLSQLVSPEMMDMLTVRRAKSFKVGSTTGSLVHDEDEEEFSEEEEDDEEEESSEEESDSNCDLSVDSDSDDSEFSQDEEEAPCYIAEEGSMALNDVFPVLNDAQEEEEEEEEEEEDPEEEEEEEEEEQFDEYDDNGIYVGDGYSDDVSVISEMTTPVVMTSRTVPEEEKYKELHHGHVSKSSKSKNKHHNHKSLNKIGEHHQQQQQQRKKREEPIHSSKPDDRAPAAQKPKRQGRTSSTGAPQRRQSSARQLRRSVPTIDENSTTLVESNDNKKKKLRNSTGSIKPRMRRASTLPQRHAASASMNESSDVDPAKRRNVSRVRSRNRASFRGKRDSVTQAQMVQLGALQEAQEEENEAGEVMMREWASQHLNVDVDDNKKEKKKMKPRKSVIKKAKGAFKRGKKKTACHCALQESFIEYPDATTEDHAAIPEHLNLLIEIVCARNILIGDTTTSDPYVLVKLGDKKIHKTSKIMKT